MALACSRNAPPWTKIAGNLGAAWALHLIHNTGQLLVSFLPAEDSAVLDAYQTVNPLPLGMAPIGLFGLLTLAAFIIRDRRAAPFEAGAQA